MDAHKIERTRKATKEQRLTAPLEEILKRLEHLERRMARLEAAMGAGRSGPQASNAEAFRVATPSAPGTDAVVMPDPRVVAPVRPLTTPAAQPAPIAATPTPSAPAVAPAPTAATPPPAAASSTADAPITLRLPPRPAQSGNDAESFPDLSLLDEKVDPKKGPAVLLNVRAALEDYPRIATRIQQLWGTPECEGYLTNLVIDTRGNRKGFPPPMMEELLYLGRLARALVILGVGGDLWDAYDQVGDRR